MAQFTASSQPAIRQMPPGITPPLVISYSASSVPILQLALSGQGLSEQQLNDFGTNFIRQRWRRCRARRCRGLTEASSGRS